MTLADQIINGGPWNDTGRIMGTVDMRELNALREELLEHRQLRALLPSLTDPDPCWFDHHGGCQAHGYLSLNPGEKCPQAEAKELVRRADAHTEDCR